MYETFKAPTKGIQLELEDRNLSLEAVDCGLLVRVLCALFHQGRRRRHSDLASLANFNTQKVCLNTCDGTIVQHQVAQGGSSKACLGGIPRGGGIPKGSGGVITTKMWINPPPMAGFRGVDYPHFGHPSPLQPTKLIQAHCSQPWPPKTQP